MGRGDRQWLLGSNSKQKYLLAALVHNGLMGLRGLSKNTFENNEYHKSLLCKVASGGGVCVFPGVVIAC